MTIKLIHGAPRVVQPYAFTPHGASILDESDRLLRARPHGEPRAHAGIRRLQRALLEGAIDAIRRGGVGRGGHRRRTQDERREAWDWLEQGATIVVGAAACCDAWGVDRAALLAQLRRETDAEKEDDPCA